MSKRTSILKALSEKLKLIDGNTPYKVDLGGAAFPKLKFWDEVVDFPSVYMSPGSEVREYLPGDFKWGFLNISLKVYCKGDESQEQLEALLEDIELVVDSNRQLVYNDQGSETTEILITGITTDEGLLAPYAVGEINLQVRYEIQ